jgi:hypothetical protein
MHGIQCHFFYGRYVLSRRKVNCILGFQTMIPAQLSSGLGYDTAEINPLNVFFLKEALYYLLLFVVHLSWFRIIHTQNFGNGHER